MPGFDRTGPMGQGPMTGGGFGQCGGARRVAQGWGQGLGRGRGRGRRFAGQAGYYGPVWQQVNAASYDEAGDLKARADELKSELEAITARLEALEK